MIGDSHEYVGFGCVDGSITYKYLSQQHPSEAMFKYEHMEGKISMIHFIEEKEMIAIGTNKGELAIFERGTTALAPWQYMYFPDHKILQLTTFLDATMMMVYVLTNLDCFSFELRRNTDAGQTSD